MVAFKVDLELLLNRLNRGSVILFLIRVLILYVFEYVECFFVLLAWFPGFALYSFNSIITVY